MRYSEEYRTRILEQMKIKTIKEISQETGISQPTLYNWKRKYIGNDIEVKEEKKKELKEYSGNKEDWDYRKGLSLYKNKKYQKAIFYLQKSVEKQNDLLERSIFFIGKIHSIQKRYKEAENEFRKCIEIAQDRTPHARLELGKLYASQGKTKEAEREFRKYIEIDKDRNPHARLELGRLYAKQGKTEEAEIEFKRCIEIAQDRTPHARLELGKLYVSQGKTEEAEIEFRKYIEIDKDRTPHARLELGRLYAIQGKTEKAEMELKKCIEIGKDRTPHARLELGRLYASQGKTEEAESKFQEYIEIDKDKTPHARFELGRLYANQGKTEKLLQKDEKKALSNSIFTGIRAKIYVGTIENTEIEELKGKKQELGTVECYLIQVAIYEKLGQKNNALKVIKQMEEEGITVKGMAEIKDRLKSKKQMRFDLGKWDKLIGWDVARTEQYEQEEEKKKRLKDIEKEIKTDPKTQENKIAMISISNDRNIDNHVMREENKTVIQPTRKDETNNFNGTKKTRKKDKVSKESKTIYQDMDQSLRKVIEEIQCKYYVRMQPSSGNKDGDIGKQERYIKKYDKLQTVLNRDSSNKRMQMELMLILINEGYREDAKKSFPEEDYEFVDGIIKQYLEKRLKPKDAIKAVDEYCL